MNSLIRSFVIAMSLLIATLETLCAQEPPTNTTCEFFERYEDWPEDLKIPGALVVADSVEGFCHFIASSNYSQKRTKAWTVIGSLASSQALLAAPEIKTLFESLDRITWTQNIESLGDAEPETFLVVCDDRPVQQIPAQRWQAIGEAMRGHMSKGGTVGFVGPACLGLGKTYPKKTNPEGDFQGELEKGLGLFPDALIDFTLGGQCDRALCETIQAADRSVLLSIAKGNAWVLQGRKGMLFGPGAATAWVGASGHVPEASQRIEARSQRNANAPESFLIDWTQWRRRAIERTLDAFPPPERQRPHVSNGTLIIVGGGGMPGGLMQKFVELAGGPEARLVYVPCAEEEDMSRDTGLLEVWRQMGARTCSLMHTKNRRVADRDEKFLEPLKDATGIWFGGGRQWNLADSYYGTQAHRLMKQVLDRGGVIAGSSAGASIQGNYLARATPIENFRIMAPGYERGGLGFLCGVAIDQHFTQRRRQKDLASLVETYPQLIGIGIDETTAVVVKKSIAEIVGPGTVTFNWKNPNEPDLREFVGKQGQRFDLAERSEKEGD